MKKRALREINIQNIIQFVFIESVTNPLFHAIYDKVVYTSVLLFFIIKYDIDNLTLSTAPEYNPDNPPFVVPSGSVLIVDWTSSFFINGEVEQFILQADDAEVYRGSRMRYSYFRESFHRLGIRNGFYKIREEFK